MKKEDIIREAIRELARKGGQSGTGKSKRRGSKAYYRELQAKAAETRRRKREAQEELK